MGRFSLVKRAFTPPRRVHTTMDKLWASLERGRPEDAKVIQVGHRCAGIRNKGDRCLQSATRRSVVGFQEQAQIALYFG